METYLVVILFIFGILGGFLSGLLGVGGGIIFVPILASVLTQLGIGDEELAKYILANSFAATFFAGSISSYKQYKLNAFYPKQILLTAVLAIPSSLIITYLITKGTWYNKQSFSIFFIILLIIMLFRFLMTKRPSKVELSDTQSSKFMITGALSGVISALSGLGGGIIMVPLFTQYMKLRIRMSAAISIGVIPIMMIPMIISYGIMGPENHVDDIQIGYLLPSIFLPLIAGLLFAAPTGVTVAQKISEKLLKIIFASLILIVIIKTIGTIIL